MTLKNKKILIIIGGGISAYKSLDLIRLLKRDGFEIKTVLTRVGEGTKVVLTGDIQQIDNVYINSTTNGLTYVVEKFKNQPISGHVLLRKGERSEVATISADIL